MTTEKQALGLDRSVAHLRAMANSLSILYNRMDRLNERNPDIPARLTAVCNTDTLRHFRSNTRKLVQILHDLEQDIEEIREQVYLAEQSSD